MFSSAKWLELLIPFPFSIIQVFSVIALLFHQKVGWLLPTDFLYAEHMGKDGERKTDRRNIRCVRLTPPLPARGVRSIRDPPPRRLPNCVRRYAPVAHTSADSIMSLIQSRALPSVPVPCTPVRTRAAHSRPLPALCTPVCQPRRAYPRRQHPAQSRPALIYRRP